MPNAADVPVADEPPLPVAVPHAAGDVDPKTQAFADLSLYAFRHNKELLRGLDVHLAVTLACSDFRQGRDADLHSKEDWLQMLLGYWQTLPRAPTVITARDVTLHLTRLEDDAASAEAQQSSKQLLLSAAEAGKALALQQLVEAERAVAVAQVQANGAAAAAIAARRKFEEAEDDRDLSAARGPHAKMIERVNESMGGTTLEDWCRAARAVGSMNGDEEAAMELLLQENKRQRV